MKCLRAGLAVAAVGVWCVSLQLGPMAGVVFAASPGPVGPVVDPVAAGPGVFMGLSDTGADVYATVDGVTTVSSEALGEGICVAAGAETLGAACIAGAAIAMGCALWRSGCEAAVGAAWSGVKATGKYLIHLAWGSGHSSPAPPPAGLTSGTSLVAGWDLAYADGSGNCFGGAGYGCVSLTFPDSARTGFTACGATTGYCVMAKIVTSSSTFNLQWNYSVGYQGVPDPAQRSVSDDPVSFPGLCVVFGGVAVARWGATVTSQYGCDGAGLSSADGAHQWTTTADCSDGTTASAMSGVFHDSDSAPAAVPVPTCGGGATYPTSIAVSDTGAPAGDALPDVSYTVPSSWSDPDNAYADCLPGGSDLPCQLIWQTATDPTGTTIDVSGSATKWAGCTDVDGGCPDLDTYLATATDSDLKVSQLAVPVAGGTESYRCMWGPHHVEAYDCAKNGASSGTADQVATPVDAGDTDSCFPSGWGLANPVEWVEKPVKCALQWAFVPTSAASTVQQLQTALSGRAPWSYLATGVDSIQAMVGGWSAPDSGCDEATVDDTVFHLNLAGFKPWCALRASDGQGPFTVGAFRGVASAGIAVTFLWACYHRAKRLIGDSGPNDPSQVDVVAGDEFTPDAELGDLPGGGWLATELSGDPDADMTGGV